VAPETGTVKPTLFESVFAAVTMTGQTPPKEVGVVMDICVPDHDCTVAAREATATLPAPCVSPKPFPEITTEVPVGPKLGVSVQIRVRPPCSP